MRWIIRGGVGSRSVGGFIGELNYPQIQQIDADFGGFGRADPFSVVPGGTQSYIRTAHR